MEGKPNTFEQKLNSETEVKKLSESEQKRKEIIQELVSEMPFEYIPAELSEGNFGKAGFLKLKDSGLAYLVGSSLRSHGSEYGILAEGKKAYLICFCDSCLREYYSEKKEPDADLVMKSAIKHGIHTIVARAISDSIWDYSTGEGKGNRSVQLIDVEDFIDELYGFDLKNYSSMHTENEIISAGEGLIPTRLSKKSLEAIRKNYK